MIYISQITVNSSWNKYIQVFELYSDITSFYCFDQCAVNSSLAFIIIE